MRSLITEKDLEALAIGAAILGSGGGGSPSYNALIAKRMLEVHGPVRLLDVEELVDDDLVVPVAFMGAPLVALEKIPTGREFIPIMRAIEKRYGKKPSVLLAAEIGGANAFTSIWVAASLGIPVLNADTLGRAFPELQMSTCALHGVSASPAFLADSLGNMSCIEGNSADSVERMARHITVAMGSRALVSLYIMNGREAGQTVVPSTVSQAIALGEAVLRARESGEDPASAVVNAAGGSKLVSGVITDVDQRVEGGFLKGKVSLHCPERGGGGDLSLSYRNEFLIAQKEEEGRVLATTPDIITLLDQDSGIPITTADLQYGLRVDLIVLPAPAIWNTEAGLALVGPQYFGYDIACEEVIK